MTPTEALAPLYLSRLWLDPRHGAVRADLADCHSLHRTVLRAFPTIARPGGVETNPASTGARAGHDVLYRVEADQRPGLVTLLVQSGQPPNWAHLLPGYLLSLGDGPANPSSKRVDGIYTDLRDNITLVFRLRANPTRKIDTKSGPNGERRNGRRVPLRDDAAHIAWLRRKGEQHGFTLLSTEINPDLPDVRSTNPSAVTGRKGPTDPSEGARRLTFSSVLFEGRLRVTDAAALRAALLGGVGSGKAYGFGLLSVAPVR